MYGDAGNELPKSDSASGRDPAQILRQVFGYTQFRDLQDVVIQHVMAGGDALVLMPTGGGKSLCYQIPALALPGLAVVVSPLIALMDDQVAALRQQGCAAAALHSELDDGEARDIFRAIHDEALDILYVSPERLLSGGLLDRLARVKLALVAIDEAHCVSQWGHEFRPEYRNLAILGERFPDVPRIALTATADPRTRDDILRSLNMQMARVFAASFHRRNLHIQASPKISETQQLREFLQGREGQCGIVYCGSRAKTERTAARLAARGLPVVAFHAGLEPAVKRAAARRFRSGEPLVVVATIAFGMGIDRPDVRYVVHLDMPDSPEAYYQQIGRAGRDGERADTLLLHGMDDIARARHFLSLSTAPEVQKRVMRLRLEAMVALAESATCRTRALLACFGEEIADGCGHCDVCATPPDVFDGTEDAQKVLSAVYRTRQIFGALHLIAMLRGEKTEAIIRHGHDLLPTFAAGAGQSALHWRGVIRQLVARGVLDVDIEGHGGLRLVDERAWPVLRGETRLMLRRDAVVKPRPQATKAARAADGGMDADDPRFIRLRSWRLEESKRQGVPPYVIFHDVTLHEIAGFRPQTLAELAQVRGVGASKLERYGAAILKIITNENYLQNST